MSSVEKQLKRLRERLHVNDHAERLCAGYCRMHSINEHVPMDVVCVVMAFSLPSEEWNTEIKGNQRKSYAVDGIE